MASNTMIRTGGPSHMGNIGIGFAVPSNTALRAAELTTNGVDNEVSWLGIKMQNSRYGVIITRVAKDSPADKAKLMRGDLVLTVDGKRVRNGSQLSSLVRLTRPGDMLEVEVQRGREKIGLELTTAVLDQSKALEYRE